MDIEIEEEGNDCFGEFFYDKELYLRQKIEQEVRLEQTDKRKNTVGYHHVKLNILPSNY